MSEKELAKVYEPKSVENKWYDVWENAGYFRGDAPSDKPAYSIVIPPPNITGVLHMGHALNNTLQDILCRWKRMSGYNVLWMPGTDHAGIATQNVVERQLAAEGKDRHRPRARGVHRAGLEVERRVGRADHRPAEAARRLLRLGAGTLHHGRGALQGGARGVRPPLRGRADLPGQPPDQLVPPLPYRPLGHRGGARGQDGASLASPLSGGRLATGTWWSPPPGPRPCWAIPPWRSTPRTSATADLIGRKVLLPLVNRRDPDHRRRLRGHGVRHRRGQDHPGPRLQRLRDGEAARPGPDQHLRRIRRWSTPPAEQYEGLDRFAARKKIVADLEARASWRRSTDHALSVAAATAARPWSSRTCRCSGT